MNPVSTYRIQFNKDFTFSDFEKIIPYLHSLGVKTIYASPVFEATPGSTHGYDGTNPNRINPEIGTEEQLRRISDELKNRNMCWLQDIVPNHLAFHENNAWLMDVLEKGKASKFASYFDIIWNHPEYGDKLIVPFPGSELEKILKQKFPDGANYISVPWQDTDKKINYRRFFLVNSLICTNIHDDKVFAHYHELIKKLCDEKIFDGLRVDHIDGLYDPKKYLHDLRNIAGSDSYIIVEKILEPGENMPSDWSIEGNSGYDFLGMVNNVFTNRAAEYELTALYYDITDDHRSAEEQVGEKKRFILDNYMQGELDNLARLYRECGLADTDAKDDEIKKDITAYLVSCPVYRYYGNDIPLMKRDEGKSGDGVKRFYTRCMQFTGPLMAKGVEDTLMYTYNRFIGHNEVGDSSEFFGYTIDKFHEMMVYRQKNWPLSLNGTSTHDTKRGEDVRARLNAVTCFHEEWVKLANKWMEENKALKTGESPDRNDEYFIYQTLIGSYPAPGNTEEIAKYPDRIKEYLQKSLREAKTHTNWAEPNTEYEEACIRFAQELIRESSPFRKTFDPFLRKIIRYGTVNSLAQLVLKFTCPGVPDIYQGTELWDLSLVDPDNRRPVDFKRRQEILEDYIKNKKTFNDYSEEGDDRIKLVMLKQLLDIRNEYSDIFVSGEYVPVTVPGKYSGHVLAFMRKHGRSAILVVVPVGYALVQDDSENILEQLVPENLGQRQLLHFSNLFQIVHLDLVG